MMKLNGEQGFTLIELMIVIAIIGILAAVAIPQLTGVRSQANVSAVKSEFKNLQTSLEMYFVDYQTYPTDQNSWEDSKSFDVNEDMLVGPDETSYSYTGGSQTYSVSWSVPGNIEAGDASIIYLTPEEGVSVKEKP